MSDPTPDRPGAAGGPNSDADARLEAEIEAAIGDMSFDDMTEMLDAPRRSSLGRRGHDAADDLKTGTVVAIHGNDVFIEFGPKAQGVCPVDQFDKPPEAGAKLEFLIERFDESEGLLILNRQGAVRKAAWESIEVGQVIEARCTGVNKGGLELEVANHKAFMPAGQVDLYHIDDLSVFVGEKMPAEVIELDKRRGRIVLSRRASLEAERAILREQLMEKLDVGPRYEAKITAVKPYGAFADIGGMEGLIHISDMSYQRLKDPSEVVKVGDKVEVEVLKIDETCTPPKLGLGMKQLLTDPYESAVSEIVEGAMVSGKVTKLMDFGAFVELAPGVEGLIHISELSHERVNKVSQVVREGEVVTVKVLGVDQQRRRIGLSLKASKEQQSHDSFDRGDDPAMRKLKAKFGAGDSGLKGGIG